jgi:hypothetical protein
MNFDQSNMTLCEKEIGVVSNSTSFIPQIFRFFEKGRPEVGLMFGRISTVYNLAYSKLSIGTIHTASECNRGIKYKYPIGRERCTAVSKILRTTLYLSI